MAKVIREDLGPHLCSILGCESVAAKRYSRYGDVSHRDVWLCDDCAKQIGKLAAGSKSAEKAESEAMDIKQATPFLSPANIYEGDYADAAGSDIVIITSGVGRKPGQSRIDLAQTNVNIIAQIAPQIVKYAPNAIYLMVANPVDVLTYVFEKQKK